jgi:hypothetical protein
VDPVHTKHIVIFGCAVCILGMFAYLFVFADAPIVDTPQAPPASTAQ